jgi:hypothetical protein
MKLRAAYTENRRAAFREKRSAFRHTATASAVVAIVGAITIGSAIAGVGASSTTTTTFSGTTTTTMFVPEDITGGGNFEGGFPAGSFDSYTFTLEEPRVLIAEITNGVGGCPGDSLIELRQPGAPGNCNGEYGDDLPCIAFDDDSGLSLCSKLTKHILEPGDYELRVSAYRNGQIARYFLEVEFVAIECGNGQLEVTEGCDDGNVASGDCCSPTCTVAAAGSPCSDNVFCNGGDTCNASAACANHSGDPCPGPDGDGNCSETCNEAADACNAPDQNDTVCQDSLFCNGADRCLAGACSVHIGNPCPGPDGDASCAESCNEGTDSCTAADANGSPCSDGVFCNGTDTCSAGVCSQHAGNPCPGADGDVDCSETCDETADACTGNDPNGSACEDNLFCNGADSCSGGLCNQHAGAMCPGVDGDANCAESCSDSVAGCTGNDAQGAPCDDGIFCNGPDSCSNGSCSVHAGNPCPGPDGDSNCAESCNEAGDTCTAPDANGSACSDGVFCNGADSCAAGACSGHAGNPCPGADGDGNCSESCSESADACTAADPNGSACVDGLFCNGADSCQSGFCNAHAGDPCPGADGDNDCSETCSEAADACSGNDPNGSDCEDSLFCNGDDKCSAGSCSVHGGDPCPGSDGDLDCSETCNEAGNACTASDPNNTVCNDAVFCNGSDKCQSGSCSLHTGNPCGGPDGDANCSESCNEEAETCTAPDPNGSPCTDGLFCTGTDTCSGGACSIHLGNNCPGPDGDSGCAESCNEATDACNAHDPDGSACIDESFCNGADTCLSGMCAQHSGDPCTGPDGDGNCAESCNEAGDACNAADPGGSPCNDNLFCNGADTCAAGACSVHAGSPCPGADGDGNCAESCSEAADACASPDSNGAPCNDGVFCNGADTCLAGACSQHAGSPCAGADGDANCSETCNETTDTCNAADPNGSSCTDGLFCNGADTCSAGACSVHAGTPCAAPDGDGNCSESCSEAADACTGPDPNGSVCNDGLFCNGADTCLAGACSQHAGNPCPGPDGDLDCSETCSESADACTANDTNGSACQDGLVCNGADTCVSGLCNEHAGASVCPGADGDGDCSESCSDVGETCAGQDPQGSACDDGIFCNGADSCANGTCSVHAGNPCAGPDGDENCSETCNEAADACTAADANGSACDDGVFCNGADSCAAGACTVHAGDPCPGPDGDGSCAESCSEAAGTCTASDADASACNDGLFCNGADTCASGFCTGHAGDPCPGADADSNCAETCNEASDACTAADPNQSACNDGLFCNGADTCSSGACTQHAGDPCDGADGDENCSETCNEGTDSCTAADPNGTTCDDTLFCNGADACAAGACTGHGGDPCGDEDPCTIDTCSEASDACTHGPIDPCVATTTTTIPPEELCGDVNDDGSVKAGDALSVLRAAVGGSQCASRPCICDASGNGSIQASDALLVLRAAVGSPVSMLCPC